MSFLAPSARLDGNAYYVFNFVSVATVGIGARWILDSAGMARDYGIRFSKLESSPSGSGTDAEYAYAAASGVRDVAVGVGGLALAYFTRNRQAAGIWQAVGAMIGFGDALVVYKHSKRPGKTLLLHVVPSSVCVGLAYWLIQGAETARML